MKHILPIAFLLSSCALAEVADKSPTGFTIKSTITLNGRPEAIYVALTEMVGRWWESSHTYSGDARNMSIDAKPGGCFCEKLPNGGGVQHMTVVFAAPGQMLRMTGGLGPMQEAGLSGALTFSLAKAGDGSQTNLNMTYAAGGYFPAGMDKLAPAVDGVLSAQLASLKKLIDEMPRPAR